MKKQNIILTATLIIVLLAGATFKAEETNYDDKKYIPPKESYIPKTEYEKKLDTFSKPKIINFNNMNERSVEHITPYEQKILSDMKMKASEEIMKSGIGTKEENEWEKSRPIGWNDKQDATNFSSASTMANKKNWSYYFPQQWKAYGDAFVTSKNETKNNKEKNFVGHAALAGEDRGRTLETGFGETLQWKSDVWMEPANPFKVNAWTPGTQLYYAAKRNGTWAQLRVHGARDKDYWDAYGCGSRQVGAPYNWTFMASGNGFYCSELVAFAWRRGSDIDIIPQKNTWSGIWPMDLYESPKTYNYRGVILE